MNPNPVVILGPIRTSITEPEMVDDLDDLAESVKCSCNAGDDNPY